MMNIWCTMTYGFNQGIGNVWWFKGYIMTCKVNIRYVEDRDIRIYNDIQDWMMNHRNIWCLMWFIKL